MSQVNFSISNEMMPLNQDSVSVLAFEDNNNQNLNFKTFANRNIAKTVTDSANLFYKKYFTWEYFSSELEFE